MTRMALSLTAMNARPGGHINAFWEATTRMSMPQSSMRTSIPPAPLTESTIRRVFVSDITAPIAATSVTTPVELSLCTQATAR
jgi:hypothetical protein